MKKDIQSRMDIEVLVNKFYEKVREDKTIGHYFHEIVPVDWEKHLPIMYNFWENILFYTGTYSGNPMLQHVGIHEKHPMSVNDFTQWNRLFNETVDELFAGNQAETIKQRAQSISTVMQIKLLK